MVKHFIFNGFPPSNGWFGSKFVLCVRIIIEK